jgi:hypothetical protein
MCLYANVFDVYEKAWFDFNWHTGILSNWHIDYNSFIPLEIV